MVLIAKVCTRHRHTDTGPATRARVASDVVSERLGPEDIGGTGSYAIQAKIAACHARTSRAEDTDWVRIASLYGDLVALTCTPIVELNRANEAERTHLLARAGSS